MRWNLFAAMLVLLVGADPAAAQAVARSSNPDTAATQQSARRHATPRQPRARKAATARSAKVEPVKREVPMPPEAPSEAKAPPPEPGPGDIAGIPAEQRMKIQAALLWAGDFADVAGKEDPLVAAVKSFQKRNKNKITGVLTEEQRTDLLAAANRYQTEFGWSVVVDPATGIRMGLPAKLVPMTHDAARGTRWSSAHDEVSIETFRIKDGNLKLSDLYEHEKKHPATRKLSRSVLNDDEFFISGMQNLKYFSVRAQQRDGEVRGFTLLYDQAWEGIVAPVTGAMASAFSPFPERAAPFAALARPVEYGTGLIVSPQGHIVTTSKVANGCKVLLAAGIGNVERLAEDPESGLTLLRVYGQPNLAALALIQETATTAANSDDVTGAIPVDVTLVGIPDPKAQQGADKLREIKALLVGDSEIRLSQPVPVAGFSGAAALDAQGRFVGIMETRSFVVASAEPAAPPVHLVDAGTIRRFLAAHHVAPAAQSGDPRKAVVRMICVRD
jgi:hypothetical protein